MFPLRDHNPTEIFPIFTIVIGLLTVAAWILIQGAGGQGALTGSVCMLGAVPADITGHVVGASEAVCDRASIGIGGMFTSMFLHGSWGHLIGNMWFLWVFGNNIEDSMGHLRFVGFYLLAGVAAAGAQVAMDPTSAVPMVGGSGAISGIMGAYLVLYPRARVQTFLFYIVIALPAWVILIEWLVLQVLSGFGSLGAEGGGIAFWAHVGGFVAGVIGVKLFQRPQLVQAKRDHVQLRPDQVRRLRW